MIGWINKISDKYINFANRKNVKIFSTAALIAWMGLIAYLYGYYYLYSFPLMVFSIAGCAVIAISILIWGSKKNINYESFLVFLKKDEYSFPLRRLLVIPPLFAVFFANIFFLTLSFQKNIEADFSINNILRYELNIFIKISLLFLFYYSLLLLVCAVGKKLLKIFKFDSGSETENFLFSAGLGFIPIIFGAFFISLAGYLYGWSISALVIFLFFFSFKEIKEIIKNLNAGVHRISLKSKASILKNFIFAVFIVLFSFNFIMTLKPVPITTDDLHTYFNAPDLFASYRAYRPLKHIHTANMSQNTEMVYAAIISTVGAKFTVHFQLFSFILCLIGFWTLLKKIFDENHACLGVLTVYFIPWNAYYASTLKVEFFLSFYLVLTLISFFSWLKTNGRKSAYLFGIMSGVALGIKYNAAFLILPLFFLASVKMLIGSDKLKSLKCLMAAGIFTAALFLPWAAKNQYFFGSPLYPFSFGSDKNNITILGSDKRYREERMKEVYYLRNSLGYEKNSILFAVKSLWSQSVGKGTDKGAWINFGFIPILILPFFLLMPQDKKIIVPLAISIFYLALWFVFNGGSPWYAFFGILFLYSLLPCLLLRNKLLMYSYLSFMAAITLLSFYIIPDNFNYLIGAEDINAYKYNTIPYLKTAEHINGMNLRPDEKILLALDSRVAFIERNDELFYVDPYLSISSFSLSRGEEAFADALKKSSVKYIAYSFKKEEDYLAWTANKYENLEDYLSRYAGSIPSIYENINSLNSFLNNNARLIFSDGYYELYKINGEK